MKRRGTRTKTRPAQKTKRRSTKKTASRRSETAARADVCRDTPRSSLVERRLDSILRALPDKELTGLATRVGIRIDKRKRIDGPAQVARALVRLPDLREPSRLPSASVQLLYRIVEAGGSLLVDGLPAGVEALVRRGLVYARMVAGGIELMVPTAFVLQLPNWEGEDPRTLRALLVEAPFETASAIASHYLQRPSTPPIALSLEPAWEVLGNPESLRAELARVSHDERRLLDLVDQGGGEVDTQELMDLERDPMRVRGAYGVAAGRRGAAFSLEKRGFLLPIAPNRYVIPAEVAAIIGAARHEQRERSRETIRAQVMAEDYFPRRARFSVSPVPLALAMAIALRERGTEIKPAIGTPRSLVNRLAQRFGRELETTALIVALSRAVGLWEPGGVSTATPPWSLRLDELELRLFNIWRRGGAWDEGRVDAELFRLPADGRDPSPARTVREMVLEALQALGEGQWVPYEALMAYLEEDSRAGGVRRLLSRWADRVGCAPPGLTQVARRILIESLPTLGVVDVGGSDTESAAGSQPLADLALRLTARGRAMILPGAQEREPQASEFVGAELLRVGTGARVAEVIELGPFVELAANDAELELSVSQAALTRGLTAGIPASQMRARLATLAPLSQELALALERAGTVVGRGTLAPVSAFLWVEDPDVREMLRTRPASAELFVDPSPPAGLLVAPGVDPDRLVRKCRALGVEIDVAEGVTRARTSSVPPPRKSETTRRRTVSWRPPPLRSTGSQGGDGAE